MNGQEEFVLNLIKLYVMLKIVRLAKHKCSLMSILQSVITVHLILLRALMDGYSDGTTSWAKDTSKTRNALSFMKTKPYKEPRSSNNSEPKKPFRAERFELTF